VNTAVMPTYGRADISFEKGEGVYLIATDGRRYLDFGAGIAVNALGHSHPRLVKALQDQVGTLWHTSNLYHIPQQTALAELLCKTSFADLVFFGNSGAEAVEGCIKLARKYQDTIGHPEKYRVITCSGSFHGRSFATLSASKNPKHLAGFGPETEGFDQISFNNLNELRDVITSETAAIIVEPIQGEGGIRPADIEYLKGLRAAADEYGLLLIFDEVQTGMGRTAKLWAHEWAGIEPDVMAVAKGLGGGMPIGAIMATANAAQGMVPGTHGSTYGGNYLSATAALTVLEEVTSDGFLSRVQKVADYLLEKAEALIAKHPDVFQEVRGKGLMLGFVCKVTNLDMWNKLRDAGLLTVPADDNVVRFLPPLIIENSHADEAIYILDKVASAWEHGDGGA
jgi:acetylornithine/N-succinyldiaminopimelate aminotransferase